MGADGIAINADRCANVCEKLLPNHWMVRRSRRKLIFVENVGWITKESELATLPVRQFQDLIGDNLQELYRKLDKSIRELMESGWSIDDLVVEFPDPVFSSNGTAKTINLSGVVRVLTMEERSARDRYRAQLQTEMELAQDIFKAIEFLKKD